MAVASMAARMEHINDFIGRNWDKKARWSAERSVATCTEMRAGFALVSLRSFNCLFIALSVTFRFGCHGMKYLFLAFSSIKILFHSKCATYRTKLHAAYL